MYVNVTVIHIIHVVFFVILQVQNSRNIYIVQYNIAHNYNDLVIIN